MSTPAQRESITADLVRQLARKAGFDLAGVTAAAPPVPDFGRFRDWVDRGLAGEMSYLTDRRADLRSNLDSLLPGVRTVVCVGLVYNGPEPRSTEFTDTERAWISRYAWGDDYHPIMWRGLEALARELEKRADFRWRACADTAPVLERSLAHQAGLGWIGRNTCLINQGVGSWFFLGELLTTLEISPDTPPPDRCGTCTRCIEACPTAALVPRGDGSYELDARRCISYFTIELRGPIPEEHHAAMGNHVFGCDICQDVCPWNRRAAVTTQPRFAPAEFAPPLEKLAALSEEEFRRMFRHTPVARTKYAGFMRNVEIALRNRVG